MYNKINNNKKNNNNKNNSTLEYSDIHCKRSILSENLWKNAIKDYHEVQIPKIIIDT